MMHFNMYSILLFSWFQLINEVSKAILRENLKSKSVDLQY